MFSLRDLYISFLEDILKFQSYKSHKKYLDFLLMLSHLFNPLSNKHFIYWKCICISCKVHIFNCTSDNFTCITEAYSMGPDKTASISKLNWVHIESHWVGYQRHRLQTNIEMKQTANDEPIYHDPSWNVDTSQGDRTIIVQTPWGYRRMTVRCPYDFIGPARALCGDLAGSLRLSQESTIIFGQKWQSKTLRCPHDHRVVHARGSYDVTAMCLRATGLRFFFQICHCAELNDIVEATMSVNPYDDRKVSLRRRTETVIWTS